MDRLGAALEVAQQIVADLVCPHCEKRYHYAQTVRYAGHIFTCGHERRFTSPAPYVDACEECGGRVCRVPAHERRRRAREQHRHAA
jgi:hypothetical protein